MRCFLDCDGTFCFSACARNVESVTRFGLMNLEALVESSVRKNEICDGFCWLKCCIFKTCSLGMRCDILLLVIPCVQAVWRWESIWIGEHLKQSSDGELSSQVFIQYSFFLVQLIWILHMRGFGPAMNNAGFLGWWWRLSLDIFILWQWLLSKVSLA